MIRGYRMDVEDALPSADVMKIWSELGWSRDLRGINRRE